LVSLCSKASTSASQLASMTFSETPTVPQTASASLALDDDADPRGGAGAGVDDAHLVVDQVHLASRGKCRSRALRTGAVQGVDRAVPLADGVLDGSPDPELDRRLGDAARRRSGPRR
jgi:hypothetical protein